MTEYIAPLKDLKFAINELANLSALSRMSAFEHATDDLLEPILDEAARFAREPVDALPDLVPALVERWRGLGCEIRRLGRQPRR